MLKDKLGSRISIKKGLYSIGKFYYTAFPNVWLKNNTVNIEDLDDVMLPVIQCLNDLGRKNNVRFTITSGKDFIHSKKSYHYVGRAVDISFRSADQEKDILNWANQGSIFQELKDTLNPSAPNETSFDIVWEKDHVHVEYDPHMKSKGPLTSTSVKPNNQSAGLVSSQQNPTENLISYYHTDPSIASLSELIDQNPLFKDVSQTDLENLQGLDGLTNKQRIESTYINLGDEEKEKWPLLKPGTLLYVKPSSLVLDSLSMESVHQVKPFQSWGDYRTETQKALAALEGYRPAYWGRSSQYQYAYPIKYINSFFQVWIFSKVRNEVLNVTNYCSLVRYSTDLSNNDSFSLTLNFIFKKTESKNYKPVQNVFQSDSFQEMKGSSFAKEISENDIVFISMEQLFCEKTRSTNEASIGLEHLADQYYDFIGLVSTVNQNSDAQGMGNVQISGQSLSKIFNIDEAVFRPIAALEDSFAGSLIIGDRKKRGWLQRMFVDGQYHSLFTDSLRTIGNTLKFYLNVVSNIGLLPLNDVGQEQTDLFYSWGNERTRLFVFEDGIYKNVSQEFAKGIYQIIKLQIEPELDKRHLSDGSIQNPQGTIMSLIQNACRQPLVETIMDTYKNTFDVICRVPPFSKKAIQERLEDLKCAERDNGYDNIAVEDVESENLTWETDFYTWFELYPKGSIIPIDELVSLCYIPTLFLSDFIDIWGSRSLSVVSPYSALGSSNEENIDEIKQAIDDLCWLVESYFYLPFTRKGTIVLSVPDRRIKKGEWIRYLKTGEMFYVESVEQIASVSSSMVSRKTVLTVSRGLVEKYVTSEGKGYFDIIDFDALANSLKGFSEQNKSTKNVAINKDLFNFFCLRRQMDDTLENE